MDRVSEIKLMYVCMYDENVTSLYFATPFAFNASDRGVSLGRSP